jgi:glycogen synthase
MKILVCGGRDYKNVDVFCAEMDRLHKEVVITKVITGDAKGADTMAWQWAEARNIPCSVYHADWKRHGKSAGPIRNQLMLDDAKPELVVAFPGGPGTRNMMEIARKAGVAVLEVG